MSKVSFTQNISDVKNIKHRDVDEIFLEIGIGSYQEAIEAIRTSKNKSDRQVTKKHLGVVMWSGLFNSRRASDIVSHTGYICLDFDKYDTYCYVTILFKL